MARAQVYWCVLAFLACTAQAAERVFDWAKDEVGAAPKGFLSTLSGTGKLGDWQVILDDAPSQFASLTPNAPQVSKRRVLAQLSRNPRDERFPLLIFQDETYGDFTLTTQFKLVGGAIEQMAGIAFRIQDEKNFYVVRASGLGGTFRFYRVANGERDQPIGVDVPIEKGVWHSLSVQCKGNSIKVKLDGLDNIPEMTDNSFSEGKIGFWTKSDSVTYFVDTRIVYTTREYLAQAMVREMLQTYPRLLALKVFSTVGGGKELQIVASEDSKDLKRAAGQVEKDVVAKDAVFCGKSAEHMTVTMPLHDRNGDPVAAVRVVMHAFPGETDQAAVARATPIIKKMEARVRSVKDLTE